MFSFWNREQLVKFFLKHERIFGTMNSQLELVLCSRESIDRFCVFLDKHDSGIFTIFEAESGERTCVVVFIFFVK
jgi:hypothetical protein